MPRKQTKSPNDALSGRAGGTILSPQTLLFGGPPPIARSDIAILVEDDRIARVDDRDALVSAHPGVAVLDLPDCLVMPGLINAHQHGRGLSALQQGFRDDLLERVIASRNVRPALDCEPLVGLACAEMLRNGVTCTVQANVAYGGNYETEIRAMLRVYDAAGIRAAVCVGAQDRGRIVYPQEDEPGFLVHLPDELRRRIAAGNRGAYAGDGPATVALMDRLLADYGDHPRIKLLYGPAGPQWLSDEFFTCLVDAARNQGVSFHLHCLETRAQQAALGRIYPEGVLAHLDGLGVLSPSTTLAHCVFLSSDDMNVAKAREITIVHNPGSNLRLHNGAAPVAQFMELGIRVAIGTDNRALEEGEDLFKEIRLAQALARSSEWDGPPALGVDDLFAMATVNGAQAATVRGDVGTIDVGMKADLIAVSLGRVCGAYLDAKVPIHEAVMARAEGTDVRLTMVDGRILYRDDTLFSIDEAALRRRVHHAAETSAKNTDAHDRHMVQILCDHLTEHYRRMTTGEADDAQ